ncbi:SMODS domain-containing nucleotidyltransferase [Microbacterium sp. Mcb102]|uniref:SMODS domain-containing nucleotidyltransferase n=1 Tax=Microbacterium sp. Mcb102 TaxID=2926012 RepID=UPI0021C7C003|nr:hypothetical protein [Microbacterium sp. Mcb102]
MTARVREFNLFLQDYVNLNQTRIKTLQTRVSNLDDFLLEDSTLADVIEDGLVPQGSFAHKTIIRPFTGNDFDADVLLPMEEQEDWEPKKYTVELQKALEASSRYEEKTILKTRCVTVNYAGDFHIDVVPFITRADGSTYITHRTNNEFLRCDPKAFTSWIEEQARATNGHLIRVIRLVKYLRDRSSIQTPSVVLAALLAERVRSFAGVDDYTNVATTLVSLVEGLHEYIGSMTSKPWVDDRIGQNLADRLTESGFKNLQSQVKTWAGKMRTALDADAAESVEKWQSVFGDNFGAAKKESLVLAGAALETYEKRVAPGEQRLPEDFGIPIRLDPKHRIRVVGRAAATTRAGGRFRQISARGNHVRIGRKLRFTVEDCTVEKPYDVYWKVRNAGEEAANLNDFRGEIRQSGDSITETSTFAGNHWVQAWAVKDDVAVATSIQDVTIVPS